MLLTLTSDIGQQDYLAAAVKGQLIKSNSNFIITDITHQLSPFNYPQAAYVCRNAIKNFPEGTFQDRKSTRLNSSHIQKSRMPSSA